MYGFFWIVFAFGLWLLPYFILSKKIKILQDHQKHLIDKIIFFEKTLSERSAPEADLHIKKPQERQSSATVLDPITAQHDNTTALPDLITARAQQDTAQMLDATTTMPPIPNRPLARMEPDERSLSVVTSVWMTLSHWFSGGNTIVRVGVLILLIGVGLLLRLLKETIIIPIEAWLSVISIAAILFISLGLRLSQARRGYALSLQGAGIATLYLTLFSAYRLYQVLPSQLTFGLLAILASITTIFALRQDALPLAVLGFGAAFFAPILTSTQQGQVVLLFSYYLLINLALAWIAYQRTWKILNLLGATATFGMATLWGWHAFDPLLRWPMEILLIAHVVLYVFIAVRYSQLLAQAPVSSTTPSPSASILTVDSGLLFGVPLVAFGLQASLLQDVPYALAVSSALLATLYLGLAYWLKQQRLALPLLRDGILALGLGFLALVLPLALNAQWTSTGWLIQGVVLVWVGVQQSRYWQVIFGLFLQSISLLILVWLWLTDADQSIWLELLIAFSTVLLSAGILRAPCNSTPSQLRFSSLALMILSVAVGIWLLQDRWSWLSTTYTGSLLWLPRHTATQLVWDLLLLCQLGLLLSLSSVWHEMRWLLRQLSLLIGGLLLCLIGQDLLLEPRTLHSLLLASVAWLSVQLWIWRHLYVVANQQQLSLRQDQAVGLALILLLLSLWSFEYVPHAVALVLLPIGLLLLLQTMPKRLLLPNWLDLARSQQDLYWPVAGGLSVWVVVANTQSSGQLFGLPYLPLLNILDGCILAVCLWLYRGLQQPEPVLSVQQRQAAQLVLGGLLFWSLSGVVVRSLHQWLDTPLWPAAWHNDTVQTSLTMVWSVTALLVTVLASRSAWRSLWWVGIGLLVMVTAKLLLVDLSNLSAMARVISFIGAGGLMLVIGYVAPLPPEQPQQRPEDDITP